ncbi:unnamed protein product [Rotaria sordida]|uniref:NHL repeat containing protein n=1 Tax=Rotaria sordida TaxID=392033 RepID=A0A819Q0Z8_9BILA|nr:unnamed protein product [Rotaria sordida]
MIQSIQVTSTTAISYRWNATAKTIAGIVGSSGNGSSQLDSPYGLVVDSSGAIYVADAANNRVQKWIIGASSGTTVTGQADGTYSFGPSYLFNPTDVLVDSNGTVYVSDTGYQRIQRWTDGSSSGTTVAGTGTFGPATNQLYNQYGLAWDSSSGALYIADESNDRIVQYLPGATNGTVVAGGNGRGINVTQLYLPKGIFYDSSTHSIAIANEGGNNVVR